MPSAPFDFIGKTALLLGGTTGLGHALSLGFARAGADVVASARTTDSTEAVAAEIRGLGRRTLAQTSDVTSRQSLEQLREQVLAEFAQVDILVNCAGITGKHPALTFPEETWDHIFDVNLTGTLRACQIFGRDMIARRAGRVINIASLSTFVAFHEVSAYGASKAAVGSLTKSLAVEWAPYGVAVNAIAPGIFPTALNTRILDSSRGQELLLRTPAARFGAAEELVTTALYLASEAATFTTGQIIAVDGGFLASGVNQ